MSGGEHREHSWRRSVWIMILASVVYKLVLAASVTGWVLVDDAYITLRYARNLIDHGELAFNLGEAVFGVTTPLWALLTTGLYGLFGDSVGVAVTVVNIALWSLSAWIVAAACTPGSRLMITALFLFLPNLIDNQLLGMETALFVCLMLGGARLGSRGNLTGASACIGLLLVTRPEGVLMAVVLLGALLVKHGGSGTVRKLLRPAPLLLLLLPGVAWTVFATAAYGSPIPQSMIAKSGWVSDHYESLVSLESSLLAIPRLTFLPFIDYFPRVARLGLALALLLGIVFVVWKTLSKGTPWSRTWLAFYVVYIGFYLLGKGATEASWYSVPPSVALLLAAGPLLPRWTWNPRWAWSLALGLAAINVPAVVKRGGLLNSYVDGYGQCAQELNARSDARPYLENRVVIGEIGVFGFISQQPVTDVGALVSPEVMAMKHARYSFVRIVQEAEASFFVISDIAVETNEYPTVGHVWDDEQEREWFSSHCQLIAQHLDKKVYRVSGSGEPAQR